MANTSAAAPGGKSVDVGEVIDSAKFFPVPFSIAVMMIIIMLTDGFDLGTMGRVATHLVEDWGITRAELGPINTWGLIGMAIGSVGMGWLGDRIGRKNAYTACLVFLFLGSILCYIAQDVAQLTIFRFITGLGLGGVTPLAATLMSEWAPKRVRTTAVAAVVVAVPLGAALAGYIERWLVPDYGWRAMFLVGAIVPLVLFAIFFFILPESPKYMAQRAAQHPRLARALNRLVGEKRYDGTEHFYVQETQKAHGTGAAVVRTETKLGVGFIVLAVVLAAVTYYFGLTGVGLGFMVLATVAAALAAVYQLAKPKFGGVATAIEGSWFASIWTREFALITTLIWAAFAINSFVLYIFTNYLQTLLDTAEQPGTISSQAADLFFYGAFFGSIGGAILIGFFGSRWVGALLAFLGVAATAVLAIVLSPEITATTLLALCLLAGMSVNGLQAFLYAVTANAYPTEVRGAAVGMAQTFSRLGAVLSPMVVTYYFNMTPVPPVNSFLWFTAACALGTTITFFLIPRHISPGAKKGAQVIAEPREALAGHKPGGGV